jgi:hypothetical protein
MADCRLKTGARWICRHTNGKTKLQELDGATSMPATECSAFEIGRISEKRRARSAISLLDVSGHDARTIFETQGRSSLIRESRIFLTTNDCRQRRELKIEDLHSNDSPAPYQMSDHRYQWMSGSELCSRSCDRDRPARLAAGHSLALEPSRRRNGGLRSADIMPGVFLGGRRRDSSRGRPADRSECVVRRM